jgi:hypothetical protein
LTALDSRQEFTGYWEYEYEDDDDDDDDDDLISLVE